MNPTSSPPVATNTTPKRKESRRSKQQKKNRGELKGGYAAEVDRRGTQQSSSDFDYRRHAPRLEQHHDSDYDQYYEAERTNLERDYQPSYGLPRERWPKGFTNVGNSCYSNAVLQCLLSTALPNALLHPQTMPMFRRYSSNHNLLILKNKNGSIDSEDEILKDPNTDQEQKERDLRDRAREKRQLAEDCEWLSEELTSIAEEYQLVEPAPNTQSAAQNSSWWDMSGYTTDAVAAEGGAVVNPENITRHPDRLSKCLVPYQQEDAHEFLRALLSTLVMNGRNKQLSSLFDGLLESSVTCRTCGNTSLTRDRYMDLSLDINDLHITSVPHALAEFTKAEILDKDNAVFCKKCCRKQSVTKGLRLATAPSILVCHLKRFAFDRFGRLVRLHKRVQFPLRLEIGAYMSNLNKARPPPYELVGILVHQGQTCASGHYIAFVKKYGEWFRCNDSIVTKVDVETVLNQQAYICMYEVAEMREKTCYTGPSSPYQQKGGDARHPVADKFIDDDSFSISGRGNCADPSTVSVHSTKSAQNNIPSRSWRKDPGIRFLKLLREAEGFFAEFCCDTSNAHSSEPKCRDVKHKQFRTRHQRYRDDYSRDDSTVLTNDSSYPIQKSTSTDAVSDDVIAQKNSGGRSQTAPRSRGRRNHSFSGSDPGNPFRSPVKEASSHSLGGSKSSSDKRRPRSRSRRPHSVHARGRSTSEAGLGALGGANLPPLPKTPTGSRRNRRSKSNAEQRLHHL